MGRNASISRAGVRGHAPPPGQAGALGRNQLHLCDREHRKRNEQARAAAGDKNVAVAGGGTFLRQVLKLGLLDELELHIVPVILGDGMRLLDPQLELGSQEGIELTPTRVINTPEALHVRYQVNGRAPLMSDYRAA